jgi:hypothetical protein
VRAAAFLTFILCCAASARTPAERLKDQRLEAVHSQIVEWKKTRASFPAEGVYQDYRAVFLPSPEAPSTLLPAAHNAGVQVIFGASIMNSREGVLFLHAPGGDFKGTDIFGQPQEEDPQRLASKFKQHPDEAFGADMHAPAEPLPIGPVLYAPSAGKSHERPDRSLYGRIPPRDHSHPGDRADSGRNPNLARRRTRLCGP